jgi:hypothetical protein
MEETATDRDDPEVTIDENTIVRDKMEELAKWLRERGCACILIAQPELQRSILSPHAAKVGTHTMTEGSPIDLILMLHVLNKTVKTIP